jgi:hypothetical protein
MTDSMIAEIAKQVPSLAVLCFVVWLFLNKLSIFVEAFKELHKEHVDAREQSRAAIRDNTSAMMENTKAMSHLVEVIDSLKERP